MVIWLIGLSGAGKTTLGIKLKEYLAGRGAPCVLIDGDAVREFFDGDLGFKREDRVANIKRIALAVHFLESSGTNAVVCNISPFEELRKFHRAKIRGYREIYLKRSLAECKKNDVKKMYATQSDKTDIVGVDTAFDEPSSPDLVLDTGTQDIEASFLKLKTFVESRKEELHGCP
jgi:adenylylsulfate kinase